MSYDVFTRTWWKENPEWPDGKEPCAGHKYPLTNVATEEEARSMCREWNSTHRPGRLSRKAEYEKRSYPKHQHTVMRLG